MPQDGTSESSFDQLWRSVAEQPITLHDVGDEADELTADAFGAWLQRIADDCFSEGLITAEQHSELQESSATYARILGAVPPEKLRAKLAAANDAES